MVSPLIWGLPRIQHIAQVQVYRYQVQPLLTLRLINPLTFLFLVQVTLEQLQVLLVLT
ncbi:protein of unknown function [Limnospira indica PCC 8005]|uniref:Uncharacterized protein n=1 Tax=Limnospira indica PCC 8005 TaxID=376219 RepID=A0A9P1KFS6_9CYAN|nr:protein of unknown function [Limnospira indica PCC 8005]